MTNPEQVAQIAAGLSKSAASALIDGCGCGDDTELVAAGLWEPEFPPEKHPQLRQEYFLITHLGLAVRDYLKGNSNARK